MTPDIKPLVAGNWKMNGLKTSLSELDTMGEGYDSSLQSRVDMMICVPATLLLAAADTAMGSGIQIGAQDCHFNQSGAHTGDVSSEMIADCSGTSVIVGHSERRTDHGETNEVIKSKAEAGLKAELLTIVCIGETQAERKSGATLDVLKSQLDGSMPDNATAATVVVAYEPVWAIGTGLVPSADNVEEAQM